MTHIDIAATRRALPPSTPCPADDQHHCRRRLPPLHCRQHRLRPLPTPTIHYHTPFAIIHRHSPPTSRRHHHAAVDIALRRHRRRRHRHSSSSTSSTSTSLTLIVIVVRHRRHHRHRHRIASSHRRHHCIVIVIARRQRARGIAPALRIAAHTPDRRIALTPPPYIHPHHTYCRFTPAIPPDYQS